MHRSDLTAILLVFAAGFSYLNYQLLRLPSTIGLVALALVASLLALGLGQFFPAVGQRAAFVVGQIDFSGTVLHSMLGYLLFAGAMAVDLAGLARHKLVVTILATGVVVVSTLVIGVLTMGLFTVIGIPVHPIYCFLFGALISPTDPIAVLALLKRLGAPKSLEVIIGGESLFNDGVGVVVFLGLLDVATGGGDLHLSQLIALFLREAVGGAVFGLAVGYLGYWLFKGVDDYRVEVLLSLALVAGGYSLAGALRLSGPIAVVVMGLLIGNHGRVFAMSRTTCEHLTLFWELIDEVLNAILFVLLGLEVLTLTLSGPNLLAGLLVIPIVLLARLLSVGLAVWLVRRWQSVERTAVRVLTWGGLRGALSVAMALSLPREVPDRPAPQREVMLVITYVIVLFSVLVQGSTIGPLTRRWLAAENRRRGSEEALPELRDKIRKP